MMLSDDSKGTSRRYFNVVPVVLPEKYSLGILQADSCGEQRLPPSSTQFTHPLMSNHEVLRKWEQENTVESAPFSFRDSNSASLNARSIRLVEQMYELSHFLLLRSSGSRHTRRAECNPMLTPGTPKRTVTRLLHRS
jgi:hypothetical protein